MVLICGIDEAGRGPVLGPLVMCGVLIEEKDKQKLKNIGVKDSKLLLKHKREELFEKILKISKNHHLTITHPEEIDKAVNKIDGLNLNKLEGNKIIDIIDKLNPDIAIIDCPSINKEAFKEYIKQRIKNKKIKLILEHKADFKYPSVAAASILAKVTRDKEIEKIKKEVKEDFGSGYPSDPKTKEFLKKNYKKHERFFRKSWQTYKNAVSKNSQSSLFSFDSKKSNKEEKQKKEKKISKKTLDKIKKLKELGFIEEKTKTEYEKIRLKGSCSVTLYKSGKLLIQGKEKEKKEIEKIISS